MNIICYPVWYWVLRQILLHIGCLRSLYLSISLRLYFFKVVTIKSTSEMFLDNLPTCRMSLQSFDSIVFHTASVTLWDNSGECLYLWPSNFTDNLWNSSNVYSGKQNSRNLDLNLLMESISFVVAKMDTFILFSYVC